MATEEPVSKRKMGIGTLLSSIFIIATLIWGTYTLILIQGNAVRTENPHDEYSEIPEWQYDIQNWAGGQQFWFDTSNYTNLNMNDPPPQNLTEFENNTFFIVEPNNPPQLWRSTSYDRYTGQGWSKSVNDPYIFDSFISRTEAESYGTTIYTVTTDVTAGPITGSYQLLTLHPGIKVIADSLQFPPGTIAPGYSFLSDIYDTLLFEPLVYGDTGETVPISYEVTYEEQDLDYIEAVALDASFTTSEISDYYEPIDITLSQTVQDEIEQFVGVGGDAYDVAKAVEGYFTTSYELLIQNDTVIQERPDSGEEATEWFINRGGGLPQDFASAYCVFLRSLGVSARPVTGYAVGDDFGDHRELMVKHMFHWAEVYIPTSFGDGEWIQIFPLPGLGEVPDNLDPSELDILLFHNITNPDNPSQPYVFMNEPFELAAVLLTQGIPTGVGSTITFYDQTDGVDIGSAEIEQGALFPSANITHFFPSASSTPGFHNITASYSTDIYTITGIAMPPIYAVGIPDPMAKSASTNSHPSVDEESTERILGETVEVNLKLGFDNYTAYWDDTIHVHGLMTYQGEPIDGTTLNNDQIHIYWDDRWYGTTTILSDGTYSLDVYVNPLNLTAFYLGAHHIKSVFEGDLPIYAPNNSSISTVELWGKVNLSLTIDPTITSPGTTLTYSGNLALLNGTFLPSEDVELYFNDTLFDTQTTDINGDFTTTYPIGAGHPLGVFPAYANWISTLTNITGNSSLIVDVTITLSNTYLNITSDPLDPEVVHTDAEFITIWGQLTNGTHGLEGYEIDVWWDTELGAPYILDTVLTNSSGYYEVSKLVNASDEGIVSYWAEFSEAGFTPAQSDILTIEVRPYYTNVWVIMDPDPYYLNETISIRVYIFIPELTGILPFASSISVYWDGVNIGNGATNSSAVFEVAHSIPIDHRFGNIPVYAEFNSDYSSFYSNVSTTQYPQVTNYATYISINSDDTSYYLNETAHIYGQLTSDGPIMDNYTVRMRIDWLNGTYRWQETQTDALGNYDFYEPLSLGDGPATVTVMVNFTPSNRMFNGSLNTLILDFVLYDTSFTVALNATEYHYDEVLEFSGSLHFTDGMAPIAYAPITIYYRDPTGLYTYPKLTDNTGSFFFLYNYSISDTLGGIYVWAEFLSSNPLWEDALSANETAQLILYQFDLNVTTAETYYHLNETVHVYGWLTYENNGTPLQNQQVSVYWDWKNGTITTLTPSLTSATGYYEIYYPLSGVTDDTGDVEITANWTNTNIMWDNATSGIWTINIRLYQFILTLYSANGTNTYHLNETAHLQGRLTFEDNGAYLSGQDIYIYWFNGTGTFSYGPYVTDAGGYFNFYYNFSTGQDDVGPISVWAQWNNSNPLWDNATSATLSLTAQLYQFDLTLFTDSGFYYLNQTVHVYGFLTFNATGGPVSGEDIRLYWDWNNGTIIDLGTDTTDGSGYYEFYYPLSIPTDTPGTVSLQVVWTNSNPLWDDASSPLEQITLSLYTLTLTATISSPVYLDQAVVISGTLTYSSGPVYAGGTINIYIQIASVWTYVDFTTTDGAGNFVYNYYFTVPPDGPGDYAFKVNSSTGPLFIDDESGVLTTTAQLYSVNLVLTVFPITGVNSTTVYLNESVFIDVFLTFAHNGTPIGGESVDIWWFNGSAYSIMTLITDASGQANFTYSSFTYDTAWTIDVYAEISGSSLVESKVSEYWSVNLQRWATQIVGFSPDTFSLYPTETVTFTGTLEYTLSSIPIAGATVDMYINGVYNDTVYTQSDGTFSFSWTVETWRATGDYDITAVVDLTSLYNWIDSTGDGPITISVLRVQLDWISFSVTPNPVYLTEDLTIEGFLYLDNGSAFVSARVDLWWTPTGSAVYIGYEITDGSGWFSRTFTIGAGTPLGTVQVWANCTPGYVFIEESGVTPVSIDVQKVPTQLIVVVSNTTRYVGDSVTISGYFLRYDDTPLTGYDIEILWDNTTVYILETETTDGSGFFTFTHQIPPRHEEGPSILYARFRDTDPVLAGNTTDYYYIIIWYNVEVHLDTQIVFQIARGNTLTVTGYVQDSFGPVPDSHILVTFGGVSTTLIDTTSTDGLFSIDVPLSSTQQLGVYDFTVELQNLNFQTSNDPETWTITIMMEPELYVSFSTSSSIMVGEDFNLDIEADDDLGNDLTGITVNVSLLHNASSVSYFLGSVDIDNWRVSETFRMPIGIETSGFYILRVDFDGTTYYITTFGESTAHHVFDDEEIQASLSPSRVDPGTSFSLQCIISDSEGHVIMGRQISINGSLGVGSTDNNGIVTFSGLTAPSIEGMMYFRLALTGNSPANDVEIGTYEILVQAVTPPDLGMLLMLFWIGVIGVEVVVAVLLVRKFRMRGGTSTTYIRPDTSSIVKVNKDNQFIRW